MLPVHIAERLQLFADARFRFEPEPHEYYLGERKLTSFSRWIEDYINPFVEADAAIPYGRKHGMSVAEVLALWEHNRWVGSETHRYIEDFYRALMCGSKVSFAGMHPEAAERYSKFLVMQRDYLSELHTTAVELPIFCEALGICGMLDHKSWLPKSAGAYIMDWKTNGKFSTNADCYPKKMRGPFRDLLDNHENKYSFQNSFYRIILEEAGIPTAGGAMIHLPPGAAPAKAYRAIDYRHRIREVLQAAL